MTSAATIWAIVAALVFAWGMYLVGADDAGMPPLPERRLIRTS
jgi:hypothetical protein